MHLLLASRVADADVWKRAIQKTEAAFKSLYPEENFTYDFFDQRIAQFYDAEQKLLRLLAWATGLCIFISCLGLLGLVVFTTHTRTKEIGVRKVLGASVAQLVMLLSKDFVILVLGAFLVAAPLAAWFTHDWLQGFAYRVGISWWIFVVTALGMLLLALLILGIRTVKAAAANPVNSLRTE
jgi:predicted lysophospholipase L1 biosynthesis ABC-type transport system permease subunit